MTLGLFDVVGPIMHGPSSNHTGGANRIGYIAMMLMGSQPEKIRLGFHPVYMDSYMGQRSHIALIAGCLGWREYDSESLNSLAEAKSLGIPWEAYPITERERSRNTMRVVGQIGGETWEINGDSIGGGNIIIDLINGLKTHIDGNDWVAVLIADNAELLESAKDFLCGATKLSLKTQDQGQCLGEKWLFVGVCANKPLSSEELPAALVAAVQEGRLVWRMLPPIYKFSYCGAEPLFSTFAELAELCKDRDLLDVAIEYECRRSAVSRQDVLDEAEFMVEMIVAALEKGEKDSIPLIGGFTDPDDGKKLLKWSCSGKTVVNEMFAKGLGRAVILAQMNASAGRIVAAPTGGSAGGLPGALFSAAERYEIDRKGLAKAFIVAAAMGLIIGNQASFSGTIGGCQSEVGIGAAMGAGGICWMAGGSYEQIIQGAIIALKNVLGLSCDPPASAVEIPCIKRNAMGTAMSFFGAEMAMAGVKSGIAPDDVVEALADTQRLLPTELKFSHCGGLATTKSGLVLKKAWKEKLANMK